MRRLRAQLGLRFCHIPFVIALVVSSFLLRSGDATGRAHAADRPRLIVVVSVDQLLHEYLERFHNNFAPDGFFRRCEAEGAWFVECHHRHAYTVTAPGHSVMLTGSYPGFAGIVDNNWWDRRLGKEVYCVEDLDYPIVGTPPGKAELKGVSPRNLEAETVGDVLKRVTGGRGKVFGVTLKDRAAVLMSGKSADAAYWFDATSGNWVTSRYYRAELPRYMVQLNESNVSECYAGERWRLLHDASKYHLHHPDDSPFEGNYEKIGREFPHEVIGEANAEYFKQILCTPFGNEMTMRVAELMLEREQLGQDDVPDLFCVGLSSNDYVGHNFGPHSLEVEDMTYRTDLLLGRFLKTLDQHVGVGRWTLAISADHGVAPIPEYAQSIGLPALRNPLGDLAVLRKQVEESLVDRFGSPPKGKTHIERLTSHEVYLTLGTRGDDPVRFQQQQVAVRDELAKLPGIAVVLTRDELLSANIDAPPLLPSHAKMLARGSDLLTNFRRSFHPRLSGDVIYCLPPYMIQSSTPATHGQPWHTDSRVPLLWIGQGIKRNYRSTEPVGPAHIAATVSRLLQIPPPANHVEPALLDALVETSGE